MNLLLVGDSWAASYAYDTNTYWCLADALGVPEHLRQAVGGSTASQWASDFEGRLTKARDTEADAVLLSLLGNDAKEAAQGQHPPDLPRMISDFHHVLQRLRERHERVLVMYYANPAPGDIAMEAAVASLNFAIWYACRVYDVFTIDTTKILQPAHFSVGDGLHPNTAGWLHVVEAIRCLGLG